MDIIFFAAIALYIFFKLRSQFGKVDENQKTEAIKKFLKEQANTTNKENLQEQIYLQSEDKINEQNEEVINNVDSEIKADFIDALHQSKVSASNFIIGANKAFELIINAFSKGDKPTLQKLLSSDLYQKFAANIDERIKNNQILSTNIIAIEAVNVKSAKILNQQAIIYVNFLSKQINYILDSNGEILEGSKEQINEVSDIWSFSRDINSKNPNWTIISTSDQSLVN